MFSDHVKQDIFLAFQTCGCLLLCMKVVQKAPALSTLLSFSNKQPAVSIAISMSLNVGSLKTGITVI